MSWTGFKKGVNRATTQVLMKTGQVERTNDRDFETEQRRYRTMETAANKLQKEAKGYLDSLRAMTASQMRIAETIDAFYGDAGTKDGVSRSYKQAVTDLDAETIKALDGPYRTTVLDPIQRFCSYFPDINACITKREHKQMDYDRMRAQVRSSPTSPTRMSPSYRALRRTNNSPRPRTINSTTLSQLSCRSSSICEYHT